MHKFSFIPYHILGFVASAIAMAGKTDIAQLTILRLPRIFRPVRLLVVAKELRIVLDSILRTSLALAHVAVFIILLLLIFAIMGIELYSGKYRS